MKVSDFHWYQGHRAYIQLSFSNVNVLYNSFIWLKKKSQGVAKLSGLLPSIITEGNAESEAGYTGVQFFIYNPRYP